MVIRGLQNRFPLDTFVPPFHTAVQQKALPSWHGVCMACSHTDSNRENAMSNENWWTAERKAAEFWRKVKENRMRYDGRNSLNNYNSAAPIARPRVSVARLLPRLNTAN
jgi:hypothetical protein